MWWRLLPYGLAVAIVLGALATAYHKGRVAAEAEAMIATLQADLAAAELQADRYEAAAEQTERIAKEEAAAAEAELKAAEARNAELESEQSVQDAATLALEQEITALAKTKEEADALIAKLKVAKGTGRRATAADVAADSRVLSGHASP